ncbi:hypothetical protein D3C75_860700 [compost metagenome]
MVRQKLPGNRRLQHLLLNPQIGVGNNVMVVKSELKLLKRFLQREQPHLSRIIGRLSVFEHPLLHQRKECMADNPPARIASGRTVDTEVFQMTAVHTRFFLQLTGCGIVDGFIFLAKAPRQRPHPGTRPFFAFDQHHLQFAQRKCLGDGLPLAFGQRKHDYIGRNPIRCAVFFDVIGLFSVLAHNESSFAAAYL